MSLLAVPIIASLALFLVVIVTIFFFVMFRRYKEKMTLLDVQVQSDAFLINELQAQNNKMQHQLDAVTISSSNLSLEANQVSQQLEHRIKALQSQMLEQEQKLVQWQENQSQDKFYNRAFKLAAKGADVDEIIKECELPRAEVEMLLSVYQQRVRSQ